MDLELAFNFDLKTNEKMRRHGRKMTKAHEIIYDEHSSNDHCLLHKSQDVGSSKSGTSYLTSCITKSDTPFERVFKKTGKIHFTKSAQSNSMNSLGRSQEQNNTPFTFGTQKIFSNHEKVFEEFSPDCASHRSSENIFSGHLYTSGVRTVNKTLKSSDGANLQLQVHDFSLNRNIHPTTRPLSARTATQVLREKLHQKPNRPRPGSYDFSTHWSLQNYRVSSTDARFLSQRKLTHAFENLAEVLV